MNNPDLHPCWDQTLSDWQAFGLSGAAFCKEQSLSYHRFVYWRKKLTEPDHHPDEKSAVTGFARVARIPAFAPGEELTVSLPGGISITELHAGNIELLGAVLRQL
ncbi:IS66 family insertion sequence element accessory protein TnpA [Marinobacter gelidimuriae]|uniref:IS66 family insertion sequence element accessory protein TnpA n=1 Tax=Marinobacter gelidimuriae TaxID=2739064 RepID=UPI00035F5D14|nr:hypothetical protein [Marinobacter gelidimuriae]